MRKLAEAKILNQSNDKVIKVGQLLEADINDIMELERASWLDEVQADQGTILQRLQMGHIMMGIRENGVLCGMTCFSYTHCDPFSTQQLPRRFHDFASAPATDEYNVAFGYNLNIHPDYRGGDLLITLLVAGYQRMKEDGVQFMFGDGRCPSYNGSSNEQEKVAQRPAFKACIDRYMKTGEFPSTGELIQDSHLRYFHRVMACEFVAIFPDFLPSDLPTGGFRVMYRKEIT